MPNKTWNGGSATTNNMMDGDNWGGSAPVTGDYVRCMYDSVSNKWNCIGYTLGSA